MARIRTIKPEFFTSEDIVALSPLARLLYVAMWCEADKDGRLMWKPMTLKLRYLPGDDCDVATLCAEIVERGLVVLYGDGFAHIPSFGVHQHVNPREAASQIPSPEDVAKQSPRVATRAPRVPHASPRVNDACPTRREEGKGREGKGKEGIASDDATPDGVPDSVWQDFQKTRKTKITKTALDGIRAEAARAGLSLADALAMACRRGWQGFEAAWLQDIRQPEAPDTGDPDSRASVEAVGVAIGVGRWNEMLERFDAYKARVKAVAGVAA